MWKSILLPFSFLQRRNKQQHKDSDRFGGIIGEKQWTIERTKRNRRRVREKMCSFSTAHTCPDIFSSGRTLTAEDAQAVERSSSSNSSTPVRVVVVVDGTTTENEEKDWWVPRVSAEGENNDETILLQFNNKGLSTWEEKRREWLQRSSDEKASRRPIQIERSLSMIVSICNDFEWTESEKHDSDDW